MEHKEMNFMSINGEMMRYRRLLDQMVESCGTKHEGCKCASGKCECGEAGVVNTPVKTEAKPSAVWEKDIDLSFLDKDLTAIEKKQAAGEELNKNDLKVIELAKKVAFNKPLTDEEIAMIFGVSKMAISKIEQKALGTARKFIKKAPGLESGLKDMMRSEPRFKTHEPEAKERPVVD